MHCVQGTSVFITSWRDCRLSDIITRGHTVPGWKKNNSHAGVLRLSCSRLAGLMHHLVDERRNPILQSGTPTKVLRPVGWENFNVLLRALNSNF